MIASVAKHPTKSREPRYNAYILINESARESLLGVLERERAYLDT
jgi:hypothetical protein